MAASVYQFTLQQEKQSSYKRIEWLVVVLHLITFIVYAVTKFPGNIIAPILGIIAAGIYLLLYYLNTKKDSRSNLLELPIYLFALFWLQEGVYLMSLLVFVFSCFATIFKKKITILADETHILYNSFPKKTFRWESLNNVILKDGMLTIDFKSNSIIQQLIEEKHIDETDFNQFCAQQLQTANAKPQIV
ncbi:MAG: hypothetical protein WCI49_04475 [Ferruginibacter sp.]